MTKNIFSPADILLPEGVSLEKWSVIACDQFSSEREYWESVRESVGKEPSTLNMIIPEAYLEEIDEETAIEHISSAMDRYLSAGVLHEVEDSFIYVERTQPDGRIRKGLVGVVDLDEYDFAPDEGSAGPAIRASEGTVLDRLPPRVRVRRAAPLELPHIITFIDDTHLTVIEPLADKANNLPVLYDFDLMEGGGHIKGYQVTGSDAETVLSAMRDLHDNHGQNNMLMVMGDGNHSLAAAKVYWDECRKILNETERETHPARRALVEVNNVYDPAISFEAIHRVMFNIDATRFIEEFETVTPRGNDYEIRWVSYGRSGVIGIKADCIGTMLTMMQAFIDDYVQKTGCSVDYIHGEASTIRLAEGERCLGLILPAMDKSELFATVAKRGVFPKKSFSVGHARDKRYYLECRKIKI
jgi:hypothetical protein